jgi:hypothetical protein
LKATFLNASYLELCLVGRWISISPPVATIWVAAHEKQRHTLLSPRSCLHDWRKLHIRTLKNRCFVAASSFD